MTTNPQPKDDMAWLDSVLSNLLEDHVDMYHQDRESSAALGEDLETAKAAIATHMQQQEKSFAQQIMEKNREIKQAVVEALENLKSRSVSGILKEYGRKNDGDFDAGSFVPVILINSHIAQLTKASEGEKA